MTIVTPPLLQITNFGWAAIALIIFAVLLGIRISRRSDRQAKSGCLTVGYVTVIVLSLLSLSVALTGVMGGFVISLCNLPRYQAKVISNERYEDRDSKNHRQIMYRPTVTFTLKDGTEITQETDLSSSAPEKIGAVITVGYRPGQSRVAAFSSGKYILMGGGAVMLLVLWYCSIGSILYAFGMKMNTYFAFGWKGVLYFLIPLAMLFLFGGMGYAVVEYFRGNRPDMPLWAVVICIFFCTMLLLGGIGYLRTLTGKMKPVR